MSKDKARFIFDKIVTILIMNFWAYIALLEAEKEIQFALITGAPSLDLSNPYFGPKKLTKLPKSLFKLTRLKRLNISYNNLSTLPPLMGQLTSLMDLSLSHNKLAIIPETLGQLQQLEVLNLAANRLTSLPKSFRRLENLIKLDLSFNHLTAVPERVGTLSKLRELDISNNQLVNLPEYLKHLALLQNLNLSNNRLLDLPDCVRNLKQLRHLDISNNHLIALPEWTGEFSLLEKLDLSNNKLTDLPISIGHLKNLSALILKPQPFSDFFNAIFSNVLRDSEQEYQNKSEERENPLNPELIEAYKQGVEGIQAYLRAKAESPTTLNESKLILVGEGEVGKSCLLDALLNKPFRTHDSTHGIEIQSFKLTVPESQTEITLNAWDFGGQRVYRPTHQLFFSAPAVYLVVWKPREGSQAGQVKEWIQLVKRREPSAKILVVATHGGPNQRQPDIDRQELWDLFGHETVVDFFFVESKPDAQGQRKGIDELKTAIAQVAASLPEVGRSVPKSFADVRAALQETGKAYLPLRDVLDICRAHNMDDEIARLFITISHRLGHLTHYENDPTLRDIVILRPDWLATAMSYVLDDEETRKAHGLVKFSRLSQIWDDPTRPADTRYPDSLHRIFLKLMGRFDLSYPVPALSPTGDSDPQSLVAQFVPDNRPQNYFTAWLESPSSGDIQQTQICRIADDKGNSAAAEGLFYQLIVRLHKYSLGRIVYADSVHWQRGLVLDDDYNGRALLEHKGNDVHITVRAPYPERFLAMLTEEVKYLVESFWEGLRCEVTVPCLNPQPCIGLFEVSKLMENIKRGRPEQPCPICNEWQPIDKLLHNAPAASRPVSIEILEKQLSSIENKLDTVDINVRRIRSQADKNFDDLIHLLTDEAKEGPRLFSFFPVDRSAFNPKTWIREKFRLVLWCEHSRLPLPVLNNGDMKKGVYDLELDREWFKKSAPYLKFLTGTLGMVLPVASSAIKLALDETAYKLIEEQLDFGKSIIDATLGESAKIGDFLGAADSTHLEHGSATRADGSTLRELHALLKAKDPGFGGLVRVMNKRQEFLWVHEKFAGEY